MYLYLLFKNHDRERFGDTKGIIRSRNSRK